METSGEALSTRKSKIVVMIAVVCVVGVLILDRPVHGNRSVRSFIGQKNGAHATGTDQVSTDVLNGWQVTNARHFSSVVGVTATPVASPANVDAKGCTGVLLTTTDVLTAGHCCHGGFNFRVHTGVEKFRRIWPVSYVTIMTGYQYNRALDANNRTIFTPEKDLCMLTLTNEVDFKPEQIYISQDKPRVGQEVDIVGFGMIGSNTGSGNRLHYARTRVAPCTNALTWAANRANVINDIVCAGHGATTRIDAQNACAGDSGGPMLSPKHRNEDARTLFGILSDGDKPCQAGKNSYTDVAVHQFRDFIAATSGGLWMPQCRRP